MSLHGAPALEVLDEAIELLRTDSPKRLFACAVPGLLLTWLCLFVHYLEHVEGVRSLRPLFALGLTLGWCLRALILSRYAGRCVDRKLARFSAAPRHGATSTVLRLAVVVGIELWLWLWLLVAAVHVDPWLSLAVLPLLALRGALSPSWLAGADATSARHTLDAAREILALGRGKRLVGVSIELFVLFGALALFLNLGTLLVAAVSLSQDLLGLRLSFVRAFVSPRNHFAVLGLAGLSLSAFDPLRAAISGVLYAQTRAAQEAVEVRALIRAATSKYALRMLPWIALAALSTTTVRAQPRTAPDTEAQLQPAEEDCDETCRESRQRDDAVLLSLIAILDAPEFREFPSQRWALEPSETSFRAWLERFWRWFSGGEAPAQPAHDLSRAKPVHVPLPLLVLVALGLALALSAFVFLRSPALRPRRAPDLVPLPSRSPPPPSAVWAEPGDDPCSTSRALYLMALRGLEERGLLTLSPAHTNGDYVRALQGPERANLAQLTALFEKVRYGGATPCASELALSRRLAAQLSGAEE